MLTLTMPQSDPSADRNRSASAWSEVKTLDDRPCGTALLSAIASVEVVVGQHVEQRRERLARHHVGLLVDPHDRGPGVEGVGGDLLEVAAAAGDELAALVGGPLDGRLHAVVGGPVDERADQRAVVHRVADGQPAVGRDEPVGELVDDAAVGDDPAHRRAALARRAGRGEDDAARRPGRGRRVGLTTAALLPPSSSSERPKRSATRGPTARPMRVEPVALSRATPGWSTSACADVGSADEHLA